MTDGDGTAVTAIRSSSARVILAVAGMAAMAWALAVFPRFWSDSVVVDVARAVVAGEAFKPEVLAAVAVRTETAGGETAGGEAAGGSALRSSMLGKAAVIRLRQAEDAIRAGDLALVDQRLASLAAVLQETFQNAPDDPFLWLVQFWLDTTRNGLRPDNLRFLQMSYDLGPYEGWIAVKRDSIALAAFPALTSELAERAVSEFARLVRWGLVGDASAIAAGTAPPLRATLFARLKDLTFEQRRVFASDFYARELDDVPVPGIPPPTPQIQMPVLPPDL